ncbi:hypothetical protein AUF16_05745 [Enterococcus avium]|nr:hypothetical protein AUF16_05745 [Enterococcus avium]
MFCFFMLKKDRQNDFLSVLEIITLIFLQVVIIMSALKLTLFKRQRNKRKWETRSLLIGFPVL